MSVTTFPAKPAVPEWFKACFRDYLASWRQTLTDPTVGRAYWDTLSDCEQGDVEAAGIELRRTAGGEFPPSASTWHHTAKAVERERRLKDAIVVTREWRTECRQVPDCGDTGWQLFDCTANARCGRPVCARLDEAHTHSYAAVCPCRASNSTYQRARERERTSKRADASEGQARRSGGSGWTKVGESR